MVSMAYLGWKLHRTPRTPLNADTSPFHAFMKTFTFIAVFPENTSCLVHVKWEHGTVNCVSVFPEKVWHALTTSNEVVEIIWLYCKRQYTHCSPHAGGFSWTITQRFWMTHKPFYLNHHINLKQYARKLIKCSWQVNQQYHTFQSQAYCLNNIQVTISKQNVQ